MGALTHTEFEVLAEVRDALASAARGQREAIVGQACRVLACSPQTVYRKLKDAGFDAGRKRRSDAGESALDDKALQLVAAMLNASLNEKGQRMPIRTALEILHANGQLPQQVHESTASRQLYANHMHPDQLALPTPHVQVASRHPNHVWQFDSTTGAYYYLPGGRLRWLEDSEANKNKLQKMVRVADDLLTRYCVTDHTTHAFKVRYFLGGESAKNLIEFLCWAFWKQDASPMCGVPLYLYGDKGPGNGSHLMANFCQNVGAKLVLHAAGNSRATGSVEKAHDLARMHWETRFRFFKREDVTLDLLNDEAERWSAAFCSTRVHTRHKRPRYAAWMEISRYPGALRMPASLELLQEAATGLPLTPRVEGDMTIRFKGQRYSLKLVPGAIAGLKVTVQSNVFRHPAVDVQVVCPDTGAVTWHVVEPVAEDDWGYPQNAPMFGETPRTAAFSVVDRNRVDLTKQAYRVGDSLPTLEEANKARKAHAQAFAGQIDAMADVKATSIPTFLPRRATELDLAERRIETRISVEAAAVELRKRLGALYSPQVLAHLDAEYAGGVPTHALDDVEALFRPAADTGGVLATGTDGGLRLVGGGV